MKPTELPAITPLNLFTQDSGPTENPAALVFLHYFGGSGGEWENLTAPLTARYRCLCPDSRGHGASPDDSDAHSVADTTGDFRHLLQRLGVTECVLVGHSMGGKIALSLAADPGPDLAVRGLLLLAPSPPSGQPMSEAEKQETNDSWGNADAQEKALRHISGLPIADDLKNRFVSDNLRVTKPAWDAWQSEGSQEDISARIAGIKIPVTVLCGDSDPVIAPDLLRGDLIDRLPSAQLKIVPKAGHLLPFETPEIVAEALLNLLNSLQI